MTRDFPIMMSAPMVRALLRQVRGEPGGKTQTRRNPTKQWDALERHIVAGGTARLWVRESYASACELDEDDTPASEYKIYYRADGEPFGLWLDPDTDWHRDGMKWTPSIHMPRGGSRLTLPDVTIRRERLGDISEQDAIAEGMYPSAVYGGEVASWLPAPDMRDRFYPTTREAYAALWDSLHGPGSWERDRDKEVMVIGFKSVLKNIDEVVE